MLLIPPVLFLLRQAKNVYRKKMSIAPEMNDTERYLLVFGSKWSYFYVLSAQADV